MTSLSGYGDNYEKQISKRMALTLCGMHPLPEMGSEIIVAVKFHPGIRWTERLCVQNISGQFVAASCNTMRVSWPEVFGVEL